EFRDGEGVGDPALAERGDDLGADPQFREARGGVGGRGVDDGCRRGHAVYFTGGDICGGQGGAFLLSRAGSGPGGRPRRAGAHISARVSRSVRTGRVGSHAPSPYPVTATHTGCGLAWEAGSTGVGVSRAGETK